MGHNVDVVLHVIRALKQLMQEDGKFKAYLGYVARPHYNIQKEKKGQCKKIFKG